MLPGIVSYLDVLRLKLHFNTIHTGLNEVSILKGFSLSQLMVEMDAERDLPQKSTLHKFVEDVKQCSGICATRDCQQDPVSAIKQTMRCRKINDPFLKACEVHVCWQ